MKKMALFSILPTALILLNFFDFIQVEKKHLDTIHHILFSDYTYNILQDKNGTG